MPPPSFDMSIKRCTLYLGAALTALTIAGLVGGWLIGTVSAAQAWKEVREVEDRLHDVHDLEHDSALKQIADYTAKALRANETLCAAGKLNKFWCRTQGFEWKTLDEGDEK
jgi:hypothetical protein